MRRKIDHVPEMDESAHKPLAPSRWPNLERYLEELGPDGKIIRELRLKRERRDRRRAFWREVFDSPLPMIVVACATGLLLGVWLALL